MVPYNSKSDLPLRCPLQKQVSFAGCLIGLDVPEKTDDLMAFKKSIDFKDDEYVKPLKKYTFYELQKPTLTY